MEYLNHERGYRGEGALAGLSDARITVCGAGAVGSHVVDMLTRMGAGALTVIDFDKVDASNMGTQIYDHADIGSRKVEALSGRVFGATRLEMRSNDRKLDEGNVARLLKGAELVIDAFDNHAARNAVALHCFYKQVSCLHIGLSGGYAEVHWNHGYRVPNDADGVAPCDVPLSRTLVVMAAAIGVEQVMCWVAGERLHNVELTLRDLKITTREVG